MRESILKKAYILAVNSINHFSLIVKSKRGFLSRNFLKDLIVQEVHHEAEKVQARLIVSRRKIKLKCKLKQQTLKTQKLQIYMGSKPCSRTKLYPLKISQGGLKRKPLFKATDQSMHIQPI